MDGAVGGSLPHDLAGAHLGTREDELLARVAVALLVGEDEHAPAQQQLDLTVRDDTCQATVLRAAERRLAGAQLGKEIGCREPQPLSCVDANLAQQLAQLRFRAHDERLEPGTI